ncbi:MAG: NifB/NifX family molybdenum-iron cluster-binding protein [Candidatus Bipolaricaulia bacterium]
MKIIVATTSGGLDDQVASNFFGWTPTFTLVEVEEEGVENAQVVPNRFVDVDWGTGIQAAQWAADSRARAVIAGNYDPNVSRTLTQAGIEMFTASGMTVRKAIERYIRGELTLKEN